MANKTGIYCVVCDCGPYEKVAQFQNHIACHKENLDYEMQQVRAAREAELGKQVARMEAQLAEANLSTEEA